MTRKYRLERISQEIEEIALFLAVAYEMGLIRGETEKVEQQLKHLRALCSEKIHHEDELFKEIHIKQAA